MYINSFDASDPHASLATPVGTQMGPGKFILGPRIQISWELTSLVAIGRGMHSTGCLLVYFEIIKQFYLIIFL